MFENLVESASHQQDMVRKGRYFLATLVSYLLIVASAGLFSIHAYDAHVENQDLEFLGLVPPIVPDAVRPEPKRAAPRPEANLRDRRSIAQRTDAIDRVDLPTKVPDAVSAIKSSIPEIPKSGVFVIGPTNIDANIGGPPTDGEPGGAGTGPVVKMETTPPPKNDAATQPKKEVIQSKGVINGLAKVLPKPQYSAIAKAARAFGQVSVQVLIDERGKVISARATSGPALLRGASERAAYQTTFSPTLLSGVPVKVSGIINYNFSLQ